MFQHPLASQMNSNTEMDVYLHALLELIKSVQCATDLVLMEPTLQVNTASQAAQLDFSEQTKPA